MTTGECPDPLSIWQSNIPQLPGQLTMTRLKKVWSNLRSHIRSSKLLKNIFMLWIIWGVFMSIIHDFKIYLLISEPTHFKILFYWVRMLDFLAHDMILDQKCLSTLNSEHIQWICLKTVHISHTHTCTHLCMEFLISETRKQEFLWVECQNIPKIRLFSCNFRNSWAWVTSSHDTICGILGAVLEEP